MYCYNNSYTALSLRPFTPLLSTPFVPFAANSYIPHSTEHLGLKSDSGFQTDFDMRKSYNLESNHQVPKQQKSFPLSLPLTPNEYTDNNSNNFIHPGVTEPADRSKPIRNTSVHPAENSLPTSRNPDDRIGIANNSHCTFETMYYDIGTQSYLLLTPQQAAAGLASKKLLFVPANQANQNDEYTSNSGKSSKKIARSRTGCLTCRYRKKRCCEVKPVCSECERLSIKCKWPVPGFERKNRRKDVQLEPDEMYHEVYGVIKVLRGVIDHKVEES